MHLTLDLGTIILLHITSLMAGAAAILHSRKRTARRIGLGRLAIALITLAIGAVLAAFGERAALPLWLWTHLSPVLARSPIRCSGTACGA